MAVRRRSKTRGRGLNQRYIGCTPALSVTHSAAIAAVSACGAISVMLLPIGGATPKIFGCDKSTGN